MAVCLSVLTLQWNSNLYRVRPASRPMTAVIGDPVLDKVEEDGQSMSSFVYFVYKSDLEHMPCNDSDINTDQ